MRKTTIHSRRPAADEALPVGVRLQASATQSLDRALDLLERVVNNSRGGIALPELATMSGLSKPTAHRLMLGLRNAGLVDYNAASRRYAPSFKLYQMGLRAAVRFDVVELAAPGMDRLAAETGDTVYLSVRSGNQAVCVARRVGAYPIKTLTLEVGDGRPLGLGAGSLALLAALDDSEAESVLLHNQAQLEWHANFSVPEVRAYCAKARRDGYAFNDGLMLPEMAAIAMVIREPQGAVCGALSVAAIRSRMQPPRIEAVLRLLRTEVSRIESRLAAPDGDGDSVTMVGRSELHVASSLRRGAT